MKVYWLELVDVAKVFCVKYLVQYVVLNVHFTSHDSSGDREL